MGTTHFKGDIVQYDASTRKHYSHTSVQFSETILSAMQYRLNYSLPSLFGLIW